MVKGPSILSTINFAKPIMIPTKRQEKTLVSGTTILRQNDAFSLAGVILLVTSYLSFIMGNLQLARKAAEALLTKVPAKNFRRESITIMDVKGFAVGLP